MKRPATQIVRMALVALSTLAGISLGATRTLAKPLEVAFVVSDTDWTSAAVGGLGGGNRIGGTGTISLSGVTGSVKQAFLYWHGIDNFTPRDAVALRTSGSWSGGRPGSAVAASARIAACDGVYNVPTIFLNGNAVTGEPLGDAETNCWGTGSSRAFRADVTAIVTGDGLYTLSRMTVDECDDANGASLVVLFNDGNPANNRDLVFCEGNDSNLAFSFPGETDGWQATLPGIVYTAGPVAIQLHVADGQEFAASGLDDDDLILSTGGATVVIPDDFNRYDGNSTANAGSSRGEALGTSGSLWDVHTFDITPVFTISDTYTLTVDGQARIGGDCIGLVLAIVVLGPNRDPTSIQTTSWGNLKRMYR